MGLLYLKNMFFLKVYQQNVLYFYGKLEFFYNIAYLQKHIKVILFWCKYKTIKRFLHNQGNLIYFPIINILRWVFLELLVLAIVNSVFLLVHIVDVVFVVLKVTFLGKGHPVFLVYFVFCFCFRFKGFFIPICGIQC